MLTIGYQSEENPLNTVLFDLDFFKFMKDISGYRQMTGNFVNKIFASSLDDSAYAMSSVKYLTATGKELAVIQERYHAFAWDGLVVGRWDGEIARIILWSFHPNNNLHLNDEARNK